MKQKNEIALNKDKIYRHILGSLLFVLAGSWIFLHPDFFEDFPLALLRNPIVIKSIGAIDVLFFGLTLIIGIKNLLVKRQN